MIFFQILVTRGVYSLVYKWLENLKIKVFLDSGIISEYSYKQTESVKIVFILIDMSSNSTFSDRDDLAWSCELKQLDTTFLQLEQFQLEVFS